MAREKATFGNWLQQEAQSMAEAMDPCLKAPAPEPSSNGLEEVSLAGTRVKPVFSEQPEMALKGPPIAEEHLHRV
jgi:hypothetical protein